MLYMQSRLLCSCDAWNWYDSSVQISRLCGVLSQPSAVHTPHSLSVFRVWIYTKANKRLRKNGSANVLAEAYQYNIVFLLFLSLVLCRNQIHRIMRIKVIAMVSQHPRQLASQPPPIDRIAPRKVQLKAWWPIVHPKYGQQILFHISFFGFPFRVPRTLVRVNGCNNHCRHLHRRGKKNKKKKTETYNEAISMPFHVLYHPISVPISRFCACSAQTSRRIKRLKLPYCWHGHSHAHHNEWVIISNECPCSLRDVAHGGQRRPGDTKWTIQNRYNYERKQRTIGLAVCLPACLAAVETFHRNQTKYHSLLFVLMYV